MKTVLKMRPDRIWLKSSFRHLGSYCFIYRCTHLIIFLLLIQSWCQSRNNEDKSLLWQDVVYGHARRTEQQTTECSMAGRQSLTVWLRAWCHGHVWQSMLGLSAVWYTTMSMTWCLLTMRLVLRSSFWIVSVCAPWRKQLHWQQRISQHLPVFCYRNYTFKWCGNFSTDFVLFAVVHDIVVMQLTAVLWLVAFRAMWNMGNRRRRCITKWNVVSIYIAVWLPETVLRTVNVSSSWRICVHLCYSHKYHRDGN